jgi:hypothetical protein
MKQKLAIFGLLLILQAGDLLSTRLAFAHGAVELNPLVRALGLWPAKLLAISIVALLLIRATKLRRVWMLVVTYGCIVCWNILLVAKAR